LVKKFNDDTKERAMETREKELIAVAVSVAAGCEPCTEYHVKAAREAGAEEAELARMIETALSVRERATRRMAAVAWGEVGIAAETISCGCAAPRQRIEALAAAASALAANCGSGVRGFLAEAAKAGASERDGEVALGIARRIKKVAAEKSEDAVSGKQAADKSCGCPGATREEAPRNCC
jgi:AhpD family alkylhydroperoxidase